MSLIGMKIEINGKEYLILEHLGSRDEDAGNHEDLFQVDHYLASHGGANWELKIITIEGKIERKRVLRKM